jgi:CheY-like chemotaxis protein
VTQSILLAEDEETDVMMFRLALEKAKLRYTVVVAHDGQDAIDYLSGHPPYTNRGEHPLPGLLVLDLKMPRMTGFDVLSWLRNRPEFSQLPAVVLSSSSYPQDIQHAAQLGAREYFIKPHSISQLATVVQSATQRWLDPAGKTPQPRL